MIDVLQTISDEIISVLDKVKEEDILAMMDVMDRSRRVFVSGEGRSGFSAKGFAMRLMHLGYTV